MREFWWLAVLWAALLLPSAWSDTVEVADAKYHVLKETRQPEYWVRLELEPVKDSAGFQVVLALDEKTGTCYRLVAQPAGWRLERRLKAGQTVIAGGKQNLVEPKALDLRIWRGGRFLTLVTDGRVLAEVLDSTLREGKLAMQGQVKLKRAMLQPVPEIRFSDDFMRDESNMQLAPWEKVRGAHRFHSVREDADTVDVDELSAARKPQFDRSPNPFSFEVLAERADDWAMVKTGYWFWKDYAFAASARCVDGVWGVAFNYQSEKDFYLVRWPLTNTVMTKTQIELIHVKDDSRRRIASAWVMGQRDQWYRLGVRTMGKRIVVLLDGAPIMDVMDEQSAGGAIGLYVEGTNPVAFDDVSVTPVTRLDMDSAQWLARHVRLEKWNINAAKRTAKPDVSTLVSGAPKATASVGTADWRNYEVALTVTTPADGQRLNVIVGSDAKQNLYEVGLSRRGKGLVELVQVQLPGARRTVASVNDVILTGERTDLRVDMTRPREARIYINGTLVLRKLLSEAVAGPVQLTTSDFPGATVSNFEVRFQREEEAERAPKVSVFTQDPYMKLWSSPEGNWWPDKNKENTYWHNGDFYGRSEITLPVRPGLMLVHSAKMVSEKAGYALVQEQQPGNRARVRLLRQGKPVGEALVDLPPPPPEAPAEKAAEGAADAKEEEKAPGPRVTVHKDGRYLWVTQEGKDLFVFRDAEPLESRRLLVTAPEAIALGEIEITRFNVTDYYFEKAPTDWHRIGRWEVTNRFVCDPRWSHMAAVTNAAGILLNKHRYEGNMTMEAYMGMRMRRDSRYPRSYPRVGDLNLALCTDGQRLDSGYNFILAGWDRFWSEQSSVLLKRGVPVAETHRQLLPGMRNSYGSKRIIPVPWVASGRPVHGAWYYVKARRHGKNLELYVDGEPVYQFRDPQPVPGGNVGIFTYDAWVVVARVKISYETKVVPGRLVEPPREQQPAIAVSDHYPVVASYTHPGLSFDFEQSLQGWTTTGLEQGAHLSLSREHTGPGGHALKVTNVQAGGDFGTVVPLNGQSLDPTKIARLEFDYRIPPDVKVNLYLTFGDTQAFLRMTGLAESDGMRYRLGDLKVQADGKWHRASFPLAAAFSAWRKETPGAITRITLGNEHAGYLQAGIGGNPTGASYHLDNFRLVSVGGGSFTCQVNAPSGSSIKQLNMAIDQKPDTVPTQPLAKMPEALAHGLWYCHTNYVAADGKRTETVHLPFIASVHGPQVAATTPQAGRTWPLGPVSLTLKENLGIPANPHATEVTINGRKLEQNAYAADYDWGRRIVTLDLNRCGAHLAHGADAALTVKLADVQGNSSTWTGRLKADVKGDKTPPPEVELVSRYVDQGFESGIGEWQGGSSSYLMRDDTTASKGDWSLKVTNPILGGTFFAYALTTPFDARRFPILEFDYRVNEGVRTDLVLSGAGTAYSFGLTDNSGHGRFLGSIPGVKLDGKWHDAEVDLLGALRNQPYRQQMFQIDWFGFRDDGYMANAPGAYYHVDEMRLVPLISGARPVELSWTCQDLAGIKGYSYVWSPKAVDEPDKKIDAVSATAEFKDLPPGRDIYFHIAACDNAGNWGPARHFRFYVDRTAPEIGTPAPRPGARSASTEIRVPMSDADSGVDPDSLTVVIDGREFKPGRQGVMFDVGKSLFVWDWIQGRAKGQMSVPDGKQIAVEVRATDFAGNPATPKKWTWTMDHSKDRQPPLIQSVSSGTQKLLVSHDFESGVHTWRNNRKSSTKYGATVSRTVRDRKRSDHCLLLKLLHANGWFDAVAYEQEYDSTEYPIIAFDYAIPANVKINLTLQTNVGWATVQLSAPKVYGKSLGKLEGFKADGTWRFVWVDVHELLKKAWPQHKSFKIRKVLLADMERSGNATGASYYVDNFLIADYGKPKAQFEWSGLDITGIKGYAFAIDEQPRTEVTTKVVTTKSDAAFKVQAPGLNYFHVRAQDNGGNWSRTYHFPYFLREPEELLPEEKKQDPGKPKPQ